MSYLHRGAALFVLAALFLATGTAWADRTPSARTRGKKSSGSRTDITVPYLNNGGSNYIGNYVAPQIYKSPIVDDPANPQAKPVFNLQFYGAQQAFGDKSNGAVLKPR